MRKWTAIIADDEENLRIGIAGMLEKLWPELEIVGQAENGPDALSMFENQTPDMAFLDIRMPGMSGVAVAKKISPERLQTTVSRLKKQLEAGSGPDHGRRDIEKIIQVLENRQAPDYLRLVKVKTGNDLRFVPVSEVIYFKAEDKYTVVQTPGHEFLIKTPIKELEERLDPKTFWRVHRGAIVNVDRIKVIKRSFTNQMMIGFDSTDGTIPVSRSYEHLFRH